MVEDARGREDREKEHRDRLFDLLKRISTLNVAALVLILALLRDFSPTVGTPGVEKVPLVFFRGSLLISMSGLFFAPLDEPHQFLQVAATGLAYLAFISGVFATVPFGVAAL